MNFSHFFSNYPTYKIRKQIINSLISEYPFMQHSVLSKSLCGRDIDSIQIGNTKNMAFLSGAYHGMEWLTSLLLLKFLHELGQSIKNKKSISEILVSDFLKNRGLTIVPCVNPDGVEISLNGPSAAKNYQKLVTSICGQDSSSWQANARGIDINHNFNAGWYALHNYEIANNITGPSATRFGGMYPESEPETKAIVALCRKNKFRHAIAFHSQGEEIFWRFGDDISEKSELIAKVFSISSGYKMSDPTGLAVGGGFKDWFICEFKKPGFTIEIGKGKNPLPLCQLDPIYLKLEEMLVISTII